MKQLDKALSLYDAYLDTDEVEDEKEKIKPLQKDVLNIYTESFEGYSKKTEKIEIELSYSLMEKLRNMLIT